MEVSLLGAGREDGRVQHHVERVSLPCMDGILDSFSVELHRYRPLGSYEFDVSSLAMLVIIIYMYPVYTRQQSYCAVREYICPKSVRSDRSKVHTHFAR